MQENDPVFFGPDAEFISEQAGLLTMLCWSMLFFCAYPVTFNALTHVHMQSKTLRFQISRAVGKLCHSSRRSGTSNEEAFQITIGIGVIAMFGVVMIIYGSHCLMLASNSLGNVQKLCGVAEMYGGIAMLSIGTMWTFISLIGWVVSLWRYLR